MRHSRFLLLALVLSAGMSCQTNAQEPSDATQRLLARNATFVPRIEQVADNVHVAVDYQVSTNSMIVGDDGVIIIDPGIAVPLARRVVVAFREITDKPVKAIIYTHSHADHTNAARAFYTDGVEVWARSNFGSEARLVKENGYAGGVRASNTQGFDLQPEQKIGIGVGIPPRERPNLGNTLMADGAQAKAAPSVPGTVPPTHMFAGDRKEITIAGITLELVAAPGETDDQLYVWYPDKRVLWAGDNFYQSWPNTYPLRGTARRSVRDWIDSLSSMVDEQPEVVVPGHTGPMTDATVVLTNYRDALKWVFDKTVEGARAKMTPDALIEYTELPAHLAGLDYLQNFYGSRWGTVRDIYAQDLGWFDGDVLNLHRESPQAQAERSAALLGGVEAIAAKARDALEAGDYLGAAQLGDTWSKLEPENPEAFLATANALYALAERTFNVPARNYTNSSANRYRTKAESLLADAEPPN
ncbi:MAG: alkyl sulfatase dimerization domain-containing protein [Pseudomonadota bacterium]